MLYKLGGGGHALPGGCHNKTLFLFFNFMVLRVGTRGRRGGGFLVLFINVDYVVIMIIS